MEIILFAFTLMERWRDDAYTLFSHIHTCGNARIVAFDSCSLFDVCALEWKLNPLFFFLSSWIVNFIYSSKRSNGKNHLYHSTFRTLIFMLQWSLIDDKLRIITQALVQISINRVEITFTTVCQIAFEELLILSRAD